MARAAEQTSRVLSVLSGAVLIGVLNHGVGWRAIFALQLVFFLCGAAGLRLSAARFRRERIERR